MSAPPAVAVADGYRALLANVFGPQRLCEGESLLAMGSRPSEAELQSRWFAGEFGTEFLTTGGQRVEMVQPGMWNHAAGPDFTEVAVKIGGRLHTGCLELDWDARDWERHGHAENPAYDAAVLHVFFSRPEGEQFFTRTSRHREVAQVRIDLAAFPGLGPAPAPAEAKCGQCSFPLLDMPGERLHALLESAARHRLERKAGRLERLAALHGWDEALFQELAAALGYRRNQLPMTMLAQRLPLRLLIAHKAAAEALLFGAGGFLETKVYEQAAAETQEYLRGLWETWWKHRAEFTAMTPPRWVLAGARPQNHPQRRLGALTVLVGRWKAVRAAFERGRPALERELAGHHHVYWDHHFTLTSARADRPMAVLGETRIREIMANVAFPYFIRRGETAWADYLTLPAALENEKSRRAAIRLLGRRRDARQFQKKMFQQQALLEIYNDFCLQDHSDCAQCQFPGQLARWTPADG